MNNLSPSIDKKIHRRVIKKAFNNDKAITESSSLYIWNILGDPYENNHWNPRLYLKNNFAFRTLLRHLKPPLNLESLKQLQPNWYLWVQPVLGLYWGTAVPHETKNPEIFPKLENWRFSYFGYNKIGTSKYNLLWSLLKHRRASRDHNSEVFS